MKTGNIFFALTAALLLTASCASEDATQTGEHNQEQKTENYTVFVSGKEDTSTEQPKTRTSLNYNTGAFYWETGDNIFVKDDGDTWQTGANAISGTEVTYHRFQLSGTFAGTSYDVFYPGRNGVNDQAVIATAQTQTSPANTKHLGEAGDCGLATAKGSSGGFSFKLDHKTAILVFQPYTNDAVLKDCHLIKIEVISDNNIAGTYTLDPTTKSLTGAGNSNTITLTTKALSGTYQNGFPMTNSSASITTNGAYMVIAPGYHTLQVRYWLKSLTDNIEGTVTKQLSNFNYEENNYYDMTADLKISHYSASNYYMWDAQQNFWYNHLNANGQPDGNRPQSKASDPARWYNDVPGYNDPTGASPAITVTNTAAGCPNLNELCWYVDQGDPIRDSSELWAFSGHLYTGGMWLKKRGNISGYSTTVAPNGRNYTQSTSYPSYSNYAVPQGKPNNLNNYFYLPALGFYNNFGSLYNMGSGGYYWSSTPSPGGSTSYTHFLSFTSSAIFIDFQIRDFGYNIWSGE